MSHALNFAAIEPIMIAAPAALGVVLIVAFLVVRKIRAKKRTAASWASAAHELGIKLVADGSDLGAVARGRVNEHVVTISPASGKGRKARRSTQYSIKFEAPEAPPFRLIKRIDAEFPTVDTGNPKFDAVVAVQTDQPVMLTRFLTGSRRAAILRILSYWPDALISNREVHLTTLGLEKDSEALVDGICHLVATAETFDRPTVRPEDEAPLPEPIGDPTVDAAPTVDAPTVEAPVTEVPVVDAASAEVPPAEVPVAEAPMVDAPNPSHVPDADVLTEVRLDELTVLSDLFDSGLMPDQVAGRFEQVYQGREVSWVGEVVRVGPPDEQGRQRIAALIGSADGQNPESGRVVALTAVEAQDILTEGDVVSFSGALVNLDVTQRLFHIF